MLQSTHLAWTLLTSGFKSYYLTQINWLVVVKSVVETLTRQHLIWFKIAFNLISSTVVIDVDLVLEVTDVMVLVIRGALVDFVAAL